MNSFNGRSRTLSVSLNFSHLPESQAKFAIYLSANLFVALNLWRCFILVDRIRSRLLGSWQDFIFETLMRGYSRWLDFLELNPLVDLRRITKLTIHPTLLQKKTTNNLSSSEWNWPNNWTRTFMGGAVVIPMTMEIHTDFLVLLQTPDMTLTRLNQILREWFILQGKALIITNKQKRTVPVLSI